LAKKRFLVDRINALPKWARDYIMRIETEADPAGTQRRLIEQQDLIRELTASAYKLTATAPKHLLIGMFEQFMGFDVVGQSDLDESRVLTISASGESPASHACYLMLFFVSRAMNHFVNTGIRNDLSRLEFVGHEEQSSFRLRELGLAV
jgi:hypothetical protein